MAQIDFKPLDKFIKKQKFSITNAEYEKLIGRPLPKGKSYIKNDSAIAKWARKKGFTITNIEEAPVIVRTIYFEKGK